MIHADCFTPWQCICVSEVNLMMTGANCCFSSGEQNVIGFAKKKVKRDAGRLTLSASQSKNLRVNNIAG